MTSLPSQVGEKSRAKRALIKRATIVLPLLCLIIFGTVIGASLIVRATSASAASLATIKGHVPALVKKSTLVGATDPNQSISLSVGLKLRNAGALKTYADNTIRSQSTRKPQHLTPAQVAAAFAPLASSQQSVIDYMQSYGFHVTMTLSQHLAVDFQGTVGDAENAFHIQINNYHSPKGQDFYAPASDPSVPGNLVSLIQNVAGLDNVAHFTPPPVKQLPKSTANVSANSVTCQVAHAGNAYVPSQVAGAYNLSGFYSAGLRGEGQAVGLVEFNDYSSSDIGNYTHCYGGSSVPISKIKIDGGAGAPSGNGAFEVELDMELVLSAAPHLAALNVYEAPNSSAGSNDMWTRIVNDAVPVISTSWGLCEQLMTSADLNEENSLFSLAAAQGQTIFAASGDSGTNDCLSDDNPNAHSLAVSDPASQPYVTGVGGTTMVLSGGSTYSSETTWNNSFGAGGGGLSSTWPMPSWQQGPGVDNSTPNASCVVTGGFCREVPDVSLNASPSLDSGYRTGYLVYCTVGICSDFGGGWFSGGGTSAGAPMWAAFMALTNQKTLKDGGFNIGFINPLLYQIDQNAGGTSYANDFHDINDSSSNDTLDGGSGPYKTTANYDMATGLGSFNALNLAKDLETLANAQNGSRQAPAAKTWYFAEGSIGGSFQEFLTILNPASQNANVTVQYLFQNQSAVSKAYVAPANARFNINVNSDLGIAPSGSHKSISAIVTSDVPVVVERPMYFDWNGIRGGTDVLGATNASTTTFYFAQGDQRQTSSVHSTEFITMLNPNPTAVTVTAKYFSGGSQVGSDTISIPSLQRGTISPSYHGQAAIQLTASQGIVAERPIYINSVIPGISGSITGAASAVGATDLGSDWLFAEGHTSSTFQERLVLANFTSAATTATIKLEYKNGTVQTVQCSVNASSQFYFNVNTPSTNPGCSVVSSGTPVADVSAEVTAPTASLVAERVMYFKFGSIPGTTDVVGKAGSSSQTVYSFAEGYTGGQFSEFLTLQNPNTHAEVVTLTFFADHMIIEKEITLPPTSRTTISVNALINPIASAYPAAGSRNVSMVIQALGGGTVVAERPMYFNFGGDPGGTDVIGYTSD